MYNLWPCEHSDGTAPVPPVWLSAVCTLRYQRLAAQTVLMTTRIVTACLWRFFSSVQSVYYWYLIYIMYFLYIYYIFIWFLYIIFVNVLYLYIYYIYVWFLYIYIFCFINILFYWFGIRYRPVPVAARSEAWVCGRWPAEIAGSNTAGGKDVCLLCVVR